MKPKSVNILGKEYSIQYCDNPADVDIFKREACWGQIDFWTRTIRIYDHGRSEHDLLHSVLHEVLHGITYDLKITGITKSGNEDEIIDLLALGLADVMTRNGWLKAGE